MLLRLILAALLLAGSMSPEMQRGVEALRVMIDLVDGPAPSPLPAAASPVRRIELPYLNGLLADIYESRPHSPGLVLVPGLSRDSKNDPRLVDFAGTLARAGFTVLVPDLSGRKSLRIGAEDVPEMAAAVNFLSQRSGRPVGIAAISYAVGPALLVALSAQAGDQVRFVLGIGGYHDLDAAITYVTTGFYRTGPDQPWQFRLPAGLAPWLLVPAQADLLSDPGDRDLLRRMAARRLADSAAPLGDLAARLGPEGRSVHALFTNTDPDAVPALLAALPDRVRSQLRDLNLAERELDRLRADVILVHGRDDPAIPYTQSLALARALPAQHRHLYIVNGLGHIEIESVTLRDAFVLWYAVVTLLGRREELRSVLPAVDRGELPEGLKGSAE